MELISKIGGTILVVGMILAVWKDETYLAKSQRNSRDSHEIRKDRGMTIGGAIAELQNLINADDVPFYYKGGIEKVIETISMELPSRAEGEWIPCEERLPSEKGMYLVTSREKATAEEFGFDLDDVEVKKMRFDEDGWRIPKHIPEWINGVVHTTVLAWMPLPEPWKGEE